MSQRALTAAMMKGRRAPRVPWAVFGALTITYAGLVLWVLPALEQRKVVPDLARWVATQATTTDRVATYREEAVKAVTIYRDEKLALGMLGLAACADCYLRTYAGKD